LSETVEDANTVGMKLPQYCGSCDKKSQNTEAVSVKLQKILRQLG